MSWWTPFHSLLKITFGINLKSSADVKAFEKSLSSIFGKPTLCLPNARFCLDTCLKFLKIGKDDCVLMTPINLPDMVTIIENIEASVQFVPYVEKSFEPNYEKIKVSKNAKVFFVTPLSGVPIDMDRLSSFCKTHNLELILDLTQCFETRWNDKPLHNYTSFCFSSLCDLKVVHTHRGGYLLSDNRDLIRFADKRSKYELGELDKTFFVTSVFEDWISLTLLKPFVFRVFSQYLIKVLAMGKGDNVEAITSGQGLKFMGFRFFKFFFQSNQVQKGIGFPSFLKYRFTDLQARIGIKALKTVFEIEKRRIDNARYFYEQLRGCALELIPSGVLNRGTTFWKSPLWIKNPSDFKEKAARFGIDCSQTNLPQLHIGPYGSESNMRDNVVYMPTHWYLNKKEVERIAEFVNQYSELSV